MNGRNKISVEYCNFQELVSSLAEVISNKYGRKVLLYLLSPRDPAHLLPEIVQLLGKGDGNAHRSATHTRTSYLSTSVHMVVQYYLFSAVIMSVVLKHVF